MQRFIRTSLGLALFLSISIAHSASLETGTYALGTELASPGSFEAVLTSAAAETANLHFELVGFASLDGHGDCCTDVFHLGVNRTEVFSGSFNMGGGRSNTILFDPHGSTAVTTTFGATGGSSQGLRDEGWGVKRLGITSQVPEPKTYALLIAGLVAVGYVARRRRA